MRILILFTALLFFVQKGFSQSKAKIDSINTIVVEEIKIPLDELIEIFKKNIEDAEKLNYAEGKAQALSKLSTAYNYRGDSYDKSTEALLASIRMYESLGDKQKMAELYGDFGWFSKRINLDAAIKYMQSGIAIARDNNFKDELKDLYNNYGVLKQWKNEVDSAVYYFNEGLKIKREQKDDFGIPYSLSNLAGAYLAKGEHDTASSLLKESIQLRTQLQDSVGLGENFTQLAEVYYDDGKLDEAMPLFKQSIKIAIAKEYRKLEQFNYDYISKIFQKQNQADSALYYFKKYVDLKDQMFTESQEAKISELTIAYETEKKELALAESKIEIQQKNFLLYLSLGGIILFGIIAFLIYKQQRTKNLKLKKELELKAALAKIETQNKLEEQRLRISRDLHDNIGSQLTFVISGLQFIEYQKDMTLDGVRTKVKSIGEFTQQTIHELRDTIWAMNKNEILLSELISRFTNFINRLSISETISINTSNEVENIQESTSYSALEGIHIYRIIQEAVNNAIKYAEATDIEVNFTHEDAVKVEIKDNGKGFDLDNVKKGNGLKNMKNRSSKLKAKIDFASSPDKGTVITLTLPK
jgi:signal transduction histidine kinase